MTVNILDNIDISYLENIVFFENQFVVRPYKEYENIPQEHISLLCHYHAMYQLPTKELIDFLKDELDTNSAIEIGSGLGIIGKHLNIPCTDSYMQTLPEIVQHYKMLGQPVIKYPEHVEKLNALQAIDKYKPNIVIGSWCTQLYKSYFDNSTNASMYGIDEDKLLKKVSKYIHIGNEKSHSDKEILKKYKHKAYKFPFLISRSMSRDKNIIYIFSNE